MFNYYDEIEEGFEEESSPLSHEEYDQALDHLKGLVEDIYQTGSIEDLEFHLEEVLHVFGIKIPEGVPAIMKRSSKKIDSTSQMLNAWVGYNKSYANLIRK